RFFKVSFTNDFYCYFLTSHFVNGIINITECASEINEKIQSYILTDSLNTVLHTYTHPTHTYTHLHAHALTHYTPYSLSLLFLSLSTLTLPFSQSTGISLTRDIRAVYYFPPSPQLQSARLA